MSLTLEILVPDGVALEMQVKTIRAADASGEFGIRAGHEAFMTMLVPCLMVFSDTQGGERYAAADGGVLLVENDRVSVVTRDVATAERLEDVADAAAAMLQSRRQQEHTASAEFGELQSALLRELRKMEKRP
ncbi:MAG TPA: F0F1 ATP synthase subunit epsilon [Pirellulales bacterium]|nr:F0F1 ATP synthase subunit epsilon [Pirellulales bacterium]